MPELRGSRLNAFERLLRKADILTFVSRHEMENFRRRYRIPVRLEVVYPGVSIAPFPVAPPASEANGFRLCVVSMMSWHQKVRGLELLLEAVSRLRREIPTISLVVIGDGEYRGHLEALAARLGLSDCVRFEGRVDDPRPEVARADLLCHISFKESFGLVVLEALSLGIPVLLNDEIVIDDALPDGPSGVIRCPSNVDGICQAIRHLAARRQDLRALGATGRAYVTERFSWDRQAEVFSRLYGLSSGSGP
jgi:phosphatidylinositol alpha-1,6-mannosyltransferase